MADSLDHAEEATAIFHALQLQNLAFRMLVISNRFTKPKSTNLFFFVVTTSLLVMFIGSIKLANSYMYVLSYLTYLPALNKV